MVYSFISGVEAILKEYEIHYTTVSIEPSHITVFTDQSMKDPGFAYDNKLLDLFIDKNHCILFIGLLRIPAGYRRQHIGLNIVKQLELWAKKNDFTLFLDGCEESVPFWRKCGAQSVHCQGGFYVMGFGEGDLQSKWKYGQHLFYKTH